MGLFQDHWTVVGDHCIFARVTDSSTGEQDKPEIILVHGLGVSSAYMMPTAEVLASDFKVYVPDLPGFGKSSKSLQTLTIDELADALAAWVKINNIPRATMLGNSLGAQIIISCAVRHPQHIKSAILVGPTMDPQARSIFKLIGRLMIDAFREPLSLIPIVIRDYLRAGLRRAYRTLVFALRDEVEAKLKRVVVPTLVVRGAGDPISPQKWNETMVELLPQATLLVIHDAAHAVNYSAPVKLSQAVLEFEQRHQTATEIQENERRM